MKYYVENKGIRVLGVVQEQHVDRPRLYRQWRRFQWPILVDSLNQLDLEVVPVPALVDEAGTIQYLGRLDVTALAEFAARPAVTVDLSSTENVAPWPDPTRLCPEDEVSDGARWREYGDACFVSDSQGSVEPETRPRLIDEAVRAYARASQLEPELGANRFRWGVALLRRFETHPKSHPKDAQTAVLRWGEALALRPSQYIWRRRLQQYGPRLNKPYNFYFWIDEARRDILARGETPVTLRVEPRGSEIAPRASSDAVERSTVNFELEQRIPRWEGGEDPIAIVTPSPVRPGEAIRIRICAVTDAKDYTWNNDGEPMRLRVEVPQRWQWLDADLTWPIPRDPRSEEARFFECELAIPEGVAPGKVTLPCYFLADICEGDTGVCRHVRYDFEVEVTISATGAKL